MYLRNIVVIVRNNKFGNAMTAEEWFEMANCIFCGRAFEGSDLKESWIIIHSDNIVVAIKYKYIIGLEVAKVHAD